MIIIITFTTKGVGFFNKKKLSQIAIYNIKPKKISFNVFGKSNLGVST